MSATPSVGIARALCSLTLLAGTVVTAAASGDGLSVGQTRYVRGKTSAAAIVVENRYYRAVICPEMGGRIVEWVDKSTDRNIVFDQIYGGLLDDHGSRIHLPYQAEWVEKSPETAALRLTLPEEIKYVKTVRFFADRPVLQIDYHIENPTQDANRLLFRNVVRPSGQAFTGRELYCFSRVAGLQREPGMPRTDDQADPWCALVDPASQVVVANSFEGDVLSRLYTWRGSKVAPTYEFMFPNLEAGHTYDVRYYWMLAHGLTAVDYAHRAFVCQIEGRYESGRLSAEVDLVGTWSPMPDLAVTSEVLGPDRKVISAGADQRWPVLDLDTVVNRPCQAGGLAEHKYVILLLKLKSQVLGPEPIVVEKAFPAGGDEKLLADYRRPVRWLGEPVEQKPIPGWEKEVMYVIQPTDADRAREYMVFEETGPDRGKHVENVAFELAQNEPEGFPLHVHSLGLSGKVEMNAEAPEGLALETFVPESVPQLIWQKEYIGLKLRPGTTFEMRPDEDRTLYFRLTAGEAKPGHHIAKITFTPETARPVTIAVNVTIHPLRIPNQPLMVFDVNNVVNYLCAERNGQDYDWDAERAKNFLGDMARHAVRGQTLVGVNAPNSHYWHNKVKLRETGEPLVDAMKAAPERFRTTELPALDFSEWDWLCDRMLEHGQTHTKWPMGGCGERFMTGHSRLSSTVYGKTLPPGDARRQIIMEWYYRELVRYLEDKGFRCLCSIDDEIPAEKLAWWVQHAYRCQQMGLEPTVTQSAKTIRDDSLMNMISPFMNYWVIGTMEKHVMDLRRKQGLIRLTDWVTTYHSSANHWRPYTNTRGQCGLYAGYFDLDACWIQVYYRWRQSEAIIYPEEAGPVSSAAWEGARDGLDDANYLLLARTMIRALSEAERPVYAERLEKIVGPHEDSMIRFVDKVSSVGNCTVMDKKYKTIDFRLAKRAMLALCAELAGKLPPQPANVELRQHPLIVDGKCPFVLPEGVASAQAVRAFLIEAAGGLAFDPPATVQVDPKTPYPVLFCGTLDELTKQFRALAQHADLADLSDKYPKPGGYALRVIQKPVTKRPNKGEPEPEPVYSMVLVCGDDAGREKAFRHFLKIARYPKSQYSHWVVKH